MPRSSVRRAALSSALVALTSLALLGALIGWVGASRAYAVGPHTLYEDHLGALGVAMLLAGAASVLLGRTLRSRAEVWVALLAAILADLVVAILITLAVNEMARHPEIPRAVLAETAGGAQVVVIGGGLVLGRWIASQRRTVSADRQPGS